MEYHQDRFDDASLLIFKKDKLIAIFPACKEGSIIYSHKGLTYGGLVVGEKLKFQLILKCLRCVLEYYDEQGFQTLEIKMIPGIYYNYPSDELSYLMKVLDAELFRRDMLSVVKQNTHVRYSKDRRDGLKRARKAGLTIKSDDEFDTFWNEILIPNLKNKHNTEPVHSLEEIKLLKERFPENIVQFNVYEKQKLVAGTTIFITEQVAHSQYISADATKNQTGSLDLLHDFLLQEVFKEKPYFDFGISNENNGLQVNSGLQYWKEGFGARAVTQDFYRLPVSNFKKLDDVLI
ncbi:GNAT family N-acetyltransferase [Hanstruepera neustonica]|uniref:GNAT family N-acetyltransferase n=2 Tax=Hanstruepera neustonica TaxID=1445657 RepID=A0A2K1E1A9_9FLAO|nr:GNAT family N-acetyltransferase [Hanstruepera neustonica]